MKTIFFFAAQNLKEDHYLADSQTKYVGQVILILIFFISERSVAYFILWSKALVSILIWMLICNQLCVKANDQLRQWFEDDDALERATNGEYVHEPSIYECHILAYLS